MFVTPVDTLKDIGDTMSWKRRALEMCHNQSITFTDTSGGEAYTAILEAPAGNVFWCTEDRVVYPSIKRHKGSDKSKFWYEIYCWAQLGTGPAEGMAEYMRLIEEAQRIDNENEKD